MQTVVVPREAAQVDFAAARTTASGQDVWYADLVDDVVLVEEVSSDGQHRFALGGAGALVRLVQDAVVHPDAGDGVAGPFADGAEPGDPTPPDQVLEQLGAVFVRADAIVRRPGDIAPYALFSGPGGSWVIDPPLAGGQVTPSTAADLRDRLAPDIALVAGTA